MKRYTLFPNLMLKSVGTYLITMGLMLTSLLLDIQAQSVVSTPCGCSTYRNVGTTGQETNISSLAFSFNPSACYLIKGVLVIDTNTSWSGIRLKMEESARIDVEADLSMSNCYLSGCGDMWQGIYTVGQTYLHAYYCFIEDAEFGIKLSGLAGLVCLGTDFINDYIGIASASPFEEDTEDKVIHRGQVTGCQFYTATSLPDPYPGQYYYPSWPSTPTVIPYTQGFAAIYLSRTVGLNIGYEGAEDPDRNKVYNMRNGIILRDETVSDISGTDFYDFEGNITRSLPNPLLDLNQNAINMINVESRIKDNTMDNLMVGIYGLESSNFIRKNIITLSTPTPGYGFTRGIVLQRPQEATITQNIIYEGMRGISIEDVANDFLIENNDLYTSFYFLGINIRIFVRNAKLDPAEGVIIGNDLFIDDALASTGIHTINANLITIDDNDVDFLIAEEHQTRGIQGVGTYRSNVLYNRVNRHLEDALEGNNGIEYENSGFNTFFCNTTEDFYINLHMFGPNIYSSIVTNTMNEAEYGFAITSPTMLGVQYNHGNMWPVSYGDFGAYIFGPDPDIEAIRSRFIVDVIENSDFMPDPIGPLEISSAWFIGEYTPMEYTLTCVSEPDPLIDIDTLIKMVRTDLTYNEFNDEMTWIVKSDIFDMIIADPSLTSNTVLDSFYDVEVNNPLGKLVTWQNNLASRYGVDRNLKSLTLDTIGRLSADIVYIDSILVLSPTDSMTWIALRVLKADTLESEVAELKEYLDTENQDSHDAYENIADDLDNLTTTNDLEAYLKDALLFKAQYLLGSSFSSGDSTDLVDLASLCPWEGGRAQAVGQELYSGIINGMILPSRDNCPAPAPRPYSILPSQGASLEGDIFSITPNPAFDKVEISSDEVISDIVVFSSEMTAVYTSQPMQRNWTINMDKLPSGVYIVSITTVAGQFAKRIIRM